MPPRSPPCPFCNIKLNISTRGLFLDSAGRRVDDWHDAIRGWKTCPTCSNLAGTHVFVRFPDAYAGEGTRVLESGETAPQDTCRFHRHPTLRQERLSQPNPDPDQWECSATGVVRRGASAPARSARAPVVGPGARAGGLDDAPWSEDAAKGAVRFQVGMALEALGAEGERKLVTHFQHERNPAVRTQYLATRECEGRLVCDACGIDPGARFGRPFAHLLEVHHEVPVARGRQVPDAEKLKLLCPTCHRVAHHRVLEPRDVQEVARIVNRAR